MQFVSAQDDQWRPAATSAGAIDSAAAYPGPLSKLLTGRRCPPPPRAAPRAQPARFDAATQPPQLPSSYAAATTQDLSGYALKSDLAALAAQLAALQGQLGTLGADAGAQKQALDELRSAHNKNAKTLAADLKTVFEATGEKLTELNGRIEALAQTPVGAQALDRGGGWLDEAAGFQATALLKGAFTFAGLPGAAALAAAWLAGRRLRAQIAQGGAGGAARRPFRGRQTPTAETDADYRRHR